MQIAGNTREIFPSIRAHIQHCSCLVNDLYYFLHQLMNDE